MKAKLVMATLLGSLVLGAAGSAVAWNPWSAWYPTKWEAEQAAVNSCKNHYGYACVVDECQKRYYNYNYQWRCAAKQQAYHAPSHHYRPAHPTY